MTPNVVKNRVMMIDSSDLDALLVVQFEVKGQDDDMATNIAKKAKASATIDSYPSSSV